MKNNIVKFYSTAVFFLSTMVLFAQPGTEDNGGTGNLEQTDPQAPIDNYLWILAVVGLLFVFMKFRALYSTKIQG